MMSKIKFMFISQLLTFLSTSFAIMERNTDLTNVRERYHASFDQRQTQPDPFYDADVKMKTAICEAIFSYPSIRTENGIYVNKNAIFINSIPREIHDTIAGFNEHDTIQQSMFPCYGRHNPMLSGWDVDDYYEFMYVSGGPDPNSVFLYLRKHRLKTDQFILMEIISGIELSSLQPITITEGDATAELESLKLVAITNDVRQIEVNYIRNIMMKEETLRFSICDLSKEKKLRACEIVLEQINSVDQNFSFTLFKHMFESSSLECTDDKKIDFFHYEMDKEINRKMFTCYGIFERDNNRITTRLQLSDGYYKNTILAFVNYDDETYNFEVSIHNIVIEEIESASIPPPP